MTIKRKISIVIPCYNHGMTLPETLKSIENVRDDNIVEVIIVNDGSTDPQTCKLFDGLNNSSYILLNQSNRGLAAARNAGIHISKGEYILPLDADNRIRAGLVERGVRILQNHKNVGVVYGDAQYFGIKQGRWSVGPFDKYRLLAWNYIDACAVFRKKIWEQARWLVIRKCRSWGWRIGIFGWERSNTVGISPMSPRFYSTIEWLKSQ